MATETITKLIDDVDGTQADLTVDFSFLGTRYEIDLTEKHKDQMRKALQPWLDKARKSSGGKTTRRRQATTRTRRQKPTYEEVRAWARENGIEVSDRGRIANAVIEEYMNAN